jgi:hypothetical protein
VVVIIVQTRQLFRIVGDLSFAVLICHQALFDDDEEQEAAPPRAAPAPTSVPLAKAVRTLQVDLFHIKPRGALLATTLISLMLQQASAGDDDDEVPVAKEVRARLDWDFAESTCHTCILATACDLTAAAREEAPRRCNFRHARHGSLCCR